MGPRKTAFNSEWKNRYPWINSVPKDNYTAYCKLCKKIFSIAGKGEGSVKEHAEGDNHKKIERAAANSQNLRRFFHRKFQFNNIMSRVILIVVIILLESSETPGTPKEQSQTETSEDSQIEHESDSYFGHFSGLDGVLTPSAEVIQTESSSKSEHESSKINEPACNFESENPTTSTSSASGNGDCPEFDLGKWLGKSSSLTKPQKLDMLKRCWVPPKSYDFRRDVADSERKFIYDWLEKYSPWLSYSKKCKGGLCLFCVLFQPSVVQGILGAFIVTPFKKYKDMHDACKNHEKSKWHHQSTKSAKLFMNDVPVNVMAISGHQSVIRENRKILSSIILIIIFCGTHDLPLRGKDAQTGK